MSQTNTQIVRDLRNCAVDSHSRRVDWGEILGEDMEGWEAYTLEECEGCEREFIATATMGQDEHRYVEPEFVDDDGDDVENECMSTCGYFEGPMMNHFYPCEFVGLGVEDAARAIAHLPLCVVEMQDGETGFALTGGGMDLSWEICDAFISCGYLPPVQYCDLPDMAGKAKESRTQLILAACQRSCEIQAEWASRRRLSLSEKVMLYSDVS